MNAAHDRIYSRLVRSRDHDGGTERSSEERHRVASNGLRIIGASALQNAGDQVVNAGTVLPWLLTTIGAPVGLIGLLVPVRESGSLLPQAALAPHIKRRKQRKWVWIAGAAVQAAAAATMALVAATASGASGGVLILLALAVFSLGRSLTSIAAKDVMARTIPQGQRGQINGVSTMFSGLVAVTVGLGIRYFGGEGVPTTVLAGLLLGAAFAWVVGLFVYAGVNEPSGAAEVEGEVGWLESSWRLLRTDAPFRRFVLVRTLLLVSALSPPFLVALAASGGNTGLQGLGPFVIAQGVARVIGGRTFGRWADRSSRGLMALGALVASILLIAVLLLGAVAELRASVWLYSGAFFLLALIHTGVRVGRKTYVVDMARGDEVTDYVAVSNTVMGVLLLVTGAVNSALALLGAEVALAFLAALGLLGFFVARTLPEVG